MTRTKIPQHLKYLTFAALLAACPVQAQNSSKAVGMKFISDQISVSIRERPANDAASIGVVRSGARVSVLEVLGADSFARIKTADGREGWITSRFLSDEAAAKDQLLPVKKELADANTEVQALKRELELARQQLEKAAPAFALAGENEQLRATMVEAQRSTSELQDRYNQERAKRQTLMLGAGLVGAGVLFGLLLPYLARGKRRRYSDF